MSRVNADATIPNNAFWFVEKWGSIATNHRMIAYAMLWYQFTFWPFSILEFTKIKVEVSLEKEFTNDLKNKSSEAYKSLERNVTAEVIILLQIEVVMELI